MDQQRHRCVTVQAIMINRYCAVVKKNVQGEIAVKIALNEYGDRISAFHTLNQCMKRVSPIKEMRFRN